MTEAIYSLTGPEEWLDNLLSFLLHVIANENIS